MYIRGIYIDLWTDRTAENGVTAYFWKIFAVLYSFF